MNNKIMLAVILMQMTGFVVTSYGWATDYRGFWHGFGSGMGFVGVVLFLVCIIPSNKGREEG